MSQVTNNLTHPRFQLTEEKEEADIIWSYTHIKDYRFETPRFCGCFFNFFLFSVTVYISAA